MSNAFADVNNYFERAAAILQLPREVVEPLITPHREIRVECTIRLDNGHVRTFTGYATGKSGEEFCFAFMVNHYADGKAVSELSKRVMDAMLGL
mgnify:CR=1 FL=1